MDHSDALKKGFENSMLILAACERDRVVKKALPNFNYSVPCKTTIYCDMILLFASKK